MVLRSGLNAEKQVKEDLPEFKTGYWRLPIQGISDLKIDLQMESEPQLDMDYMYGAIIFRHSFNGTGTVNLALSSLMSKVNDAGHPYSSFIGFRAASQTVSSISDVALQPGTGHTLYNEVAYGWTGNTTLLNYYGTAAQPYDVGTIDANRWYVIEAFYDKNTPANSFYKINGMKFKGFTNLTTGGTNPQGFTREMLVVKSTQTGVTSHILDLASIKFHAWQQGDTAPFANADDMTDVLVDWPTGQISNWQPDVPIWIDMDFADQVEPWKHVGIESGVGVPSITLTNPPIFMEEEPKFMDPSSNILTTIRSATTGSLFLTLTEGVVVDPSPFETLHVVLMHNNSTSVPAGYDFQYKIRSGSQLLPEQIIFGYNATYPIQATFAISSNNQIVMQSTTAGLPSRQRVGWYLLIIKTFGTTASDSVIQWADLNRYSASGLSVISQQAAGTYTMSEPFLSQFAREQYTDLAYSAMYTKTQMDQAAIDWSDPSVVVPYFYENSTRTVVTDLANAIPGATPYIFFDGTTGRGFSRMANSLDESTDATPPYLGLGALVKSHINTTIRSRPVVVVS